jgi:hypothetical protein
MMEYWGSVRVLHPLFHYSNIPFPHQNVDGFRSEGNCSVTTHVMP